MLTLEAKVRKERASKTRQRGKIPAILYGPGIENLKLEIEEKEFEKILKESGEGSHIHLKVENKEYLVLIKEIQKHPTKDKILHVDFFQPSQKEKIKVIVPLVFVGEAEATKKGQIVVKNLVEIELKGFWQDLPKEVKVDLSKLKQPGDKIFVSDLKLPPGVEVLRPKDEIIALAILPETKEIAEEQKTS